MSANESITILYDGNCPICCRKVQFFQRRDRRQRLRFSDIRAKNFEAGKTGVPMDVLEKQIHAILPGGHLVSRMEVLRVAYKEIGLGWLAAPTGWPVLRPIFDALYGVIARHRLTISRFFR